MPTRFSLSAIAAFAAALSLAAAPAFATDLPVPAMRAAVGAAPAWAPGVDTAHNHRWYRYRRHRGVDAGDVLAGILIIGGIAAVASAAKGSERRARDDYRYRYPEPHHDDGEARGIDRAVSICASEVERNARIGSIDAVARTAQGWQVSGSLYNGDGFNCSIGGNGRIEAIDYGRGTPAPYRESAAAQDDAGYDRQDDAPQYDDAQYDDAQYDDDTYAQARARVEGAGADGPQPAYPGGPLPGEEPIDGDPGEA
ncbi:MAG: hypothetical protein WC692_00230 [Erythrobacter sp.]|jgi:hypothetical protein